MTSWLVRALLRGGRCRGLGWTAGVRYRQSRGNSVVAGNTETRSADAAAWPKNRTVGPDERLGGDPRQRRKFSRELSSHRRRMTRAPSRADGWLRPGAFMPIARMCPSRTLRPRGAGLLAKPAEPPAVPEAPGRRLRLPKRDPSGSGPWRLVISRAHTLYWKPSTTKSCPVDEARLRGREERHELRHVVGLAHAPERDPRARDLGTAAFRESVAELGLDHAGDDGVDQDGGTQLLGKRAGHAEDAGFRGGIGEAAHRCRDAARISVERGYGGNAAAALLQHDRRHRADVVEAA